MTKRKVHFIIFSIVELFNKYEIKINKKDMICFMSLFVILGNFSSVIAASSNDVTYSKIIPLQIQRGTEVPLYIQVQNTGDLKISYLGFDFDSGPWDYLNTLGDLRFYGEYGDFILVINDASPATLYPNDIGIFKMGTASVPLTTRTGIYSGYLKIAINSESQKVFGPISIEVIDPNTSIVNVVSIGVTDKLLVLQSSYDELSNEVNLLETENNNIRSDLSTLQTQVSALNNEKTNLQTQVISLKNDKVNLQSQMSSLESEKNNLQLQSSMNIYLPILLGVTTLVFFSSTIYLFLKNKSRGGKATMRKQIRSHRTNKV